MNLCGCGCGGNAPTKDPRKSKFIHGHNRRGSRKGGFPLGVIVDSEDLHFADEYTWQAGNRGYAVSFLRDETKKHRAILLHRLIVGAKRGEEVDHINRNRLDNRRVNLRIVTPAINRQNVASRSGSSSHYRGVSWDGIRKRWVARVKANGKQMFLGRFDDEREAAAIAAEARRWLLPGAVEN